MRRPRPRDPGRQPRRAYASASSPAAAGACPGSASITPLAIRERYSSRRVIGAPASAAAPVGQGSVGLGAPRWAVLAGSLPPPWHLGGLGPPARAVWILGRGRSGFSQWPAVMGARQLELAAHRRMWQCSITIISLFCRAFYQSHSRHIQRGLCTAGWDFPPAAEPTPRSQRQSGQRQESQRRGSIGARVGPHGSVIMSERVAPQASGEGTARKLWPTETDKFRDHLLRLDKESRRMRFAHSVSDSFIEDYASRMAEFGSVVYGFLLTGHVRAAAELRRLGDSWAEEAEAAFSVEKAYQDQGIGTELMGRIVRSARNRGIRRLYMSCLAENSKMQAIARKHEADLRFEYGEVIGEIMPDTPNYFSIMVEAAEDRVGFMIAVLELQSRMVRAA